MERHDQDKDMIKVASQMMEIIVMQIFTDREWKFNNTNILYYPNCLISFSFWVICKRFCNNLNVAQLEYLFIHYLKNVAIQVYFLKKLYMNIDILGEHAT
jgi:hypothetical protein